MNIFERLRNERVLFRSNLPVKNKQTFHSGLILRVNDSNVDEIRNSTINFLKTLGYEFLIKLSGSTRGKKADFYVHVSACYEDDTTDNLVAFMVSIHNKQERNVSQEELMKYYY